MKVTGFAASLFTIGTALSVSLASQSADPPMPTFRAEVEYVEVDALVTDDQGRFVPSLRKEDFQIFEDGKPQAIANFALVEIPVDRGERLGSVEPDVLSNERPFVGRIYTMILDDLHTAPSRAPRVKAVARRFIERHLAANDLMAIVHTAGRDDASQDFTSSKRLLLASVDRFMGLKLESVTLARNEEFFRGAGAGGAPWRPLRQRTRLQRAIDTRGLRTVAEWLGGVRGRRKRFSSSAKGLTTTSPIRSTTGRQRRSSTKCAADRSGDAFECQHLHRRSTRSGLGNRRRH